jgi:hypothetical protein
LKSPPLSHLPSSAVGAGLAPPADCGVSLSRAIYVPRHFRQRFSATISRFSIDILLTNSPIHASVCSAPSASRGKCNTGGLYADQIGQKKQKARFLAPNTDPQTAALKVANSNRYTKLLEIAVTA